MATRTITHPSQIKGLGNVTLYEQLRILDIESGEVDVEYVYDTEGRVKSETVVDVSTVPSVEIKKTEFNYDTEGNVTSEVSTYNGKTVTKTYILGTDGAVAKVEIRTT